MPSILFGSHNYWTTPLQVGSHALARAFAARGWDVGYVSDPISPLHLLQGSSPDLRQRIALWRGGGRLVADRIWSHVPGALVTPYNLPLLRSGFVHRTWRQFTFPGLKSSLKHAGFDKVDVVFLDSPFALGLLDIVQRKRAVARVADNFAGFTRVTAAARELQGEMLRRVDLVTYTASTLEAGLKQQTTKPLMHLPNGVRFDFFRQAARDLPDAYRGLQRPIAVYVGAMEDWFDFELVNAAARALPQMSFVMIGDARRARFAPLANIHCIGPVAHVELPRYLANADVGIIPFDVAGHADLVNSINPLKLYEYMACGLPVVSVGWEELRRIESPAQLTDTPQQFIAALERATATPPDRAGLTAYAAAQDWGARADALIAVTGLG
jgi:glycosyltransferase involved in cell wall biosynthesis